MARDDELKRQVAIKVANRVVAAADAESYLAEARIVATRNHPHIVPVYDIGRDHDGKVYVVSRLIDGVDLARHMASQSLSYRDSAEMIAVLADALHYAHLQGIVHRDVKPANVVLDANGSAYLTDFGLALRHGDLVQRPGLAGTPAYMSPEQACGRGQTVDGRSDVFSLGVVFYELLTGMRPFRAASHSELLEQIVESEPRPPRQLVDSIPRELERVCLKAIAKSFTDRYTTAGDLRDDLRHWLAESSKAAENLSHSTETVPPGDVPADKVAAHQDLSGWDFGPTLSEKRRGYCGREWLRAEIAEWTTRHSLERVMLVTGSPGTGKSSFIADCVATNQPLPVAGYYFCQAETPATLQPAQFVRTLAAQFAQTLPDYADQISRDTTACAKLEQSECRSDPVTALELGVLAPLARVKMHPTSPHLVLIDALDECLLHTGINILSLLTPRLERFPPWIRLVATSRSEPQILERLAGVRQLPLAGPDERNLADVRSFVRQRLNSPMLKSQLTSNQLTANEARERLERRAEGNFLFARHALDGLERGLYSMNRLEDLPPGLNGLFQRFFDERYPTREDFLSAQSVIEVLVAACEPLSEEVLAETIQDQNLEVSLVLEELSPVLRGCLKNAVR